MRNGTIIDDLVERLFLKLLGDPLFLEQSISGRYLRAGDLSLSLAMDAFRLHLPACQYRMYSTSQTSRAQGQDIKVMRGSQWWFIRSNPSSLVNAE
jgi:hypothetical protein